MARDPADGAFPAPAPLARAESGGAMLGALVGVPGGVAMAAEALFTTENTPGAGIFWNEQAAAARGVGGLTLGNCTPNEICRQLIAVLENRIKPLVTPRLAEPRTRILTIIDGSRGLVEMCFSMHSYTPQQALDWGINVDIPPEHAHPFYHYELQHLHGPRGVFHNILQHFQNRICDGMARSRTPRVRNIPVPPQQQPRGPPKLEDYVGHILPLLQRCNVSHISAVLAKLCETRADCTHPPVNLAHLIHVCVRDSVMPSTYAAAARIQKWTRARHGWASAPPLPQSRRRVLDVIKGLFRSSFTHESVESGRGTFGFVHGCHHTPDCRVCPRGFLARPLSREMSIERLKMLAGVLSCACDDESVEDKEEYAKAILCGSSLDLGFAAGPRFSSHDHCKYLVAIAPRGCFLSSSHAAFERCGFSHKKRPKSARKKGPFKK